MGRAVPFAHGAETWSLAFVDNAHVLVGDAACHSRQRAAQVLTGLSLMMTTLLLSVAFSHFARQTSPDLECSTFNPASMAVDAGGAGPYTFGEIDDGSERKRHHRQRAPYRNPHEREIRP
jgi:hypothetical protein